MSCTLYIDYMSQPSRACAIFIKANALPVTLEQIAIHKGQTKGAEYREKNPLGKVPFLKDEHISLPESGAILSYLANMHQVPEHWYPTSPKLRASVDAAMHWYHSTIRAGCARLVFHKVLAAKLGVTPNEAYANEGRDLLAVALEQMEAYWLKGGKRPFMTGSQMEQLTMLKKELHGTDLEDQLQRHPLVRHWMKAVSTACGPAYEESHALLRKAAGRQLGAKL